MKVYLVGGAVRDELLGLPVNERDWVVVGATPKEMKEQGFKQVGKSFPVFLHPKTGDEYALARTETKVGHGYAGFEFDFDESIRLEDDLARRDLTINAIAKSKSGKFIDPYQGRQDLKRRVLRHVSPAFVEDPVRVLRVARFAAQLSPLYFDVANETLLLMQHIVMSGEINHLVADRVWLELVKALRTPRPSLFFTVLRHCGALSLLFPEIDALFGVPASPASHPEIDTGLHVLRALDQAAILQAPPEAVFAVMMHDLGKAKTNKELWPSHSGHEEIGYPLVEAFCERYPVPNDYRDLALLVTRYHGVCHQALSLRATTIVKTLQALDVFRKPQRLDLFLLACEADSRGRLGLEHEAYPQATLFRSAYEVATSVCPQQFIDAGFEGMDIARQLFEARVAAVAKIL